MERKLTFEEYIVKVLQVCKYPQEYINAKLKNPDEQLIRMYNDYMNEIKTTFVNKDGTLINLSDINYYQINLAVNGNSAEFMFITPDFKKYLLKEITKYIVIDKGSPYISENNYKIIPQLAKEFGLKSAMYYFVDFYNEEGESEEYIVTPDFKENDNDTLILGTEILNVQKNDTLNIREMLIRIETFLHNKNIKKEYIENIKRDFLKQTFFFKLIDNKDQNNRNWGIVFEKNKVELAPLYDFEFCFGNKIKNNIERYIGNKKTDILSFIQSCKNMEWFINWIKQSIDDLNMELVYKNVEIELNQKLSDSTKEDYTRKLLNKINEVKQAIRIIKEKQYLSEENLEECI